MNYKLTDSLSSGKQGVKMEGLLQCHSMHGRESVVVILGMGSLFEMQCSKIQQQVFLDRRKFVVECSPCVALTGNKPLKSGGKSDNVRSFLEMMASYRAHNTRPRFVREQAGLGGRLGWAAQLSSTGHGLGLSNLVGCQVCPCPVLKKKKKEFARARATPI